MQDTQNLSKAELIEKLEEISAIYKGVAEIKREIKKFQPRDNYERTVKVPAFPSDVNEEDHCKRMLKDSNIDNVDDVDVVDDVDDVDDVEYVVEKFDEVKKPKTPKKPKQEKPTEPKKPNHEKGIDIIDNK